MMQELICTEADRLKKKSEITFLFDVESQDAPLYRHPTLVERNYLNMLVFAIPQKASVFWSFYGPFG